MAALIEPAEWKAWSGHQLPTSQDDQLKKAIATALEQAETYCRRPWSQATVVDEKLDGTGTAVIELRRIPIISISEIRLGNAAPFQVVNPSEYVFYGDTGIVQLVSAPVPLPPRLRYGRLWPEGEQNVRVDYVGGPTLAAVPLQVQQAIMMQVTALWFAKGQDPRLTGMEQAGRHSRNNTAFGPCGLAWNVVAMLEGHRRQLGFRVQNSARNVRTEIGR